MTDRETGTRADTRATGTAPLAVTDPTVAAPRRLPLDRRLPRGRHGIPAAEITSHQQARVCNATVEGLAELGFQELNVAEICSRAGVSRQTFYKLYDNKLECALEVQADAIAGLEEQLDCAARKGGDWQERVALTIDSLLSFAAAESGLASLVLPCSSLFAEPQLARGAKDIQTRIAGQLFEGAPPTAPAVGSTGAEVLLGGLLYLVADEMARGNAGQLSEISGELSELVIAHCTAYQGT